MSCARRDLRILRRPDNGGKRSDAPVDKQSIKLFSTTSLTCKSTSLNNKINYILLKFKYMKHVQ